MIKVFNTNFRQTFSLNQKTVQISLQVSHRFYTTIPFNPIKNGFFYKIVSPHSFIPKGYLLGTVHAVDYSEKEMLELDPRVSNAFNRCKSIFIEVAYTKEKLNRMRKVIEWKNKDLNTRDFAGLDVVLAIKADAEGREVKGFESEKQSDSYLSLYNDGSLSMGDTGYKFLVNRIKRNDADSFTSYYSKCLNKNEELYGKSNYAEIILGKRSQVFTESMDQEMKQTINPLFFMMGTAHLFDIGRFKGVVTLLKEKKWEISPLNLDSLD
jgi:uncharacterized protein YbaP (TraB family)